MKVVVEIEVKDIEEAKRIIGQILGRFGEGRKIEYKTAKEGS